jgi:hypothetical protein
LPRQIAHGSAPADRVCTRNSRVRAARRILARARGTLAAERRASRHRPPARSRPSLLAGHGKLAFAISRDRRSSPLNARRIETGPIVADVRALPAELVVQDVRFGSRLTPRMRRPWQVRHGLFRCGAFSAAYYRPDAPRTFITQFLLVGFLTDFSGTTKTSWSTRCRTSSRTGKVPREFVASQLGIQSKVAIF